MSYSRWRNENINTLQRQQMLEAVSSFKTYVIKNDLNNNINPTVGKKCLQAMGRIKEAHMKKQSVTISEILCLKREMSDIIVSDLFEEKSEQCAVKNIVKETISEVENSTDNEFKDDSNDDDNIIIEEMTKALFGKDTKLDGDMMKNLGAMTGNMLASMMNPLLTSAVQKTKPYVKTMFLELKSVKDDPSLTKEQKELYNEAFNFYSELNEVYSTEMPVMDQASASTAIERKYNREILEEALENDPYFKKIITQSKPAESDLANNTVMEGLEKLGEQCVVS